MFCQLEGRTPGGLGLLVATLTVRVHTSGIVFLPELPLPGVNGQQQHNLVVTSCTCQIQRGFSIVVFCLDIGVRVQQRCHRIVAALKSSQQQGRPAVFISGVDVGTCRQESPDQGILAFFGHFQEVLIEVGLGEKKIRRAQHNHQSDDSKEHRAHFEFFDSVSFLS